MRPDDRPAFRRPVTVRVLPALLLSLGLSAGAAQAREAAPMAKDPAMEARVMAIAEELRCLVCQNETIAASHADLAVDLRRQIEIKLGQGQSKQQILDFMVARYGDFVLYRPPLKATTLLLWTGPFVLLLVAGAVMAAHIRRRRLAAQALRQGEGALSAEDVQRVRRLLADEEENKGSGSP